MSAQPHLGKFSKVFKFLKRIHIPSKLTFVVIGVLSTIWFLIRVIPKPQRAAYPCMKAAAPWASSFVIYLLGISGSTFFFRKSITAVKNNRLAWSFVFVPVIMAFSLAAIYKNPARVKASDIIDYSQIVFPENPIGTAKGLYPGRVVWVYNKDATNENLTNTDGDYWFMDKNTNEDTVKKMLNQSIMHLTEAVTVAEAWDKLFKHYNIQRGKGSVGYKSGEKIAIKINLINSWWQMSGTTKVGQLERMDATPQLVNALLETLIDDLGISQNNITCGDNYRIFRDTYWNKCHSNYPSVNYIDAHGQNERKQTQLSGSNVLVFSDGQYSSTLPQHYIDADYFINAACLKSHEENGVTLCAKNHQGSIVQPSGNASSQNAEFMHYSMPLNSPGYGKYRNLVDFMGHKETGGKTLLYLVDGIWGGNNYAGNIFKWQMSPFNNDYPNSLFVSQDPVAIEAVCFDFLLEEYANPPSDPSVPNMDGEINKYPYINGANDYLLQAADESYWPEGISYDPENDGSKLNSQGVYEHWNNGTDKEYSGSGIDLIKVLSTSDSPSSSSAITSQEYINAYPNPFNSFITIEIGQHADANGIQIYNMSGQEVFSEHISTNTIEYRWNGTDNSGKKLNAGTYIVQIKTENHHLTTKVILK